MHRGAAGRHPSSMHGRDPHAASCCATSPRRAAGETRDGRRSTSEIRRPRASARAAPSDPFVPTRTKTSSGAQSSPPRDVVTVQHIVPSDVQTWYVRLRTASSCGAGREAVASRGAGRVTPTRGGRATETGRVAAAGAVVPVQSWLSAISAPCSTCEGAVHGVTRRHTCGTGRPQAERRRRVPARSEMQLVVLVQLDLVLLVKLLTPTAFKHGQATSCRTRHGCRRARSFWPSRTDPANPRLSSACVP